MATPKLNSWFEANPRGNLWRNDHNRFGFKMLSKMGWQEDKGLGKNEDGILELKTGPQNTNNGGVGWKQSLVAIDTQDYDNVLAKLNKVFSKSDGHNKTESTGSIEKRSQQFKNRLHYHKFVKGKDVGRYSKKDMDGIFISKKKEPTMPTVESSQNMLDYFASKMKMKLGASVEYHQNSSESCEGKRHSDTTEIESSSFCRETDKVRDIYSKLKKRKRFSFLDSTTDTELKQTIKSELMELTPHQLFSEDDASSSPLYSGEREQNTELKTSRKRKKQKLSDNLIAKTDIEDSDENASKSELISLCDKDSIETKQPGMPEQNSSQKSRKRNKYDKVHDEEKCLKQKDEVEQTSEESFYNNNNSFMPDDSSVQGTLEKSKKRKKYQNTESCTALLDESLQLKSTSTPSNHNESSYSILSTIKSCLKRGVKNIADAKRRVSFKRKLYRRDIDEYSNVTDSKEKLKDPDPRKMPYWKVGFLRKYAQFTSEDTDSIVMRLFADDASCPFSKEAIAQIKALQENAESQVSQFELLSQEETTKLSDSDMTSNVDERTSGSLTNLICTDQKTEEHNNHNPDEIAENMGTNLTYIDSKKQTNDIFVNINYGNNKRQSEETYIGSKKQSDDVSKQTNDIFANINYGNNKRQSEEMYIGSKKQSDDVSNNLTYIIDKKQTDNILPNTTLTDNKDEMVDEGPSNCCGNEWELVKISNNGNCGWQESQRIAMKMDKYRDMKHKLKKHKVLKTTNLCCIKGYGNWGL